MSPTTDTAVPHPLDVEVPADPHLLPDLRDRLTGWLGSAGTSTELTDRIVLAANEAVTNAVAHAYDGVPAGIVRVTADRDEETITIKIADEGRWRPARPGGRGGRGVLIMQECVDRVFIDKGSHGTTVKLQAEIRDVEAIPDDGDPGVELHRVDVGIVGGTTVARLHGAVPAPASVLLRRQLLSATCGGVVPLVVDLVGLEAITAGVIEALMHVARAAEGAGERVVVVVPTEYALAQLRPLDRLGDAVRIVCSGGHHIES